METSEAKVAELGTSRKQRSTTFYFYTRYNLAHASILLIQIVDLHELHPFQPITC